MQGYAEVLPDRVIILAEISERAEEIDVARSRAKMEEAQAQLSKAGSGDVDWQVAATNLARALARLQAASKS
jgi:F-type H+-transporting ATPase subunit epsilon